MGFRLGGSIVTSEKTTVIMKGRGRPAGQKEALAARVSSDPTYFFLRAPALDPKGKGEEL